MIIERIYATQPPPPLEGVTVKFTVHEWGDLQQLIAVPSLRELMVKTGHSHTWDFWGLLASLRKSHE